jgi:uncharacterized membrane protein
MPGAILRAVGHWLLLLALGYLCFLPYHWSYAAPAFGIARWDGSQTPLADYLTIHGLFLFAICGALVADLLLSRDLNAAARLLRLALLRPARVRRALRRLWPLPAALRLGFGLVAGSWLLAAALALTGRAVPGLIVALLALTALLLGRRARGRGVQARRGQALWQMALVLTLVGLVLTLAAEFFVPKGLDVGRMNTVFKLYLQVWVLWGLAAAAAVAFVSSRRGRLQPEWRAVWRYELALLIGAALLYPLTATPARILDRFDASVGPTLDGMAFMTRAVLHDRNQAIPLVYDLQAIRWIQQTVAGSPVIAEANIAPTLYGWGNRVSVYTGNPTVIGWDWHERQQRGVVPFPLVNRRVEAVQRAYSTADPREAHAILSGFDVQYIVVGPLERAYFPDGQDTWARGEGTLWDLVYRNPEYRIYQVRGGAPAP